MKKSKTEIEEFHCRSVFVGEEWNTEGRRTIGEHAGKQLLSGRTTAILTYGQSNTGKTRSLISLLDTALATLFALNKSATITLTALVLHQSQQFDLISPSHDLSAAPLTPESLQKLLIQRGTDVPALLTSSVFTHPKLTSQPSRAHAILVFTVDVGRGAIVVADLPEHEKVKSTWANTAYIEEAKHINRSLTLLGECFHRQFDRKMANDTLLTATLAPMIRKRTGRESGGSAPDRQYIQQAGARPEDDRFFTVRSMAGIQV